MGADGALLKTPTGEVYHVNMLEKLLATILAKMSNFVPEAGIWLNTQRPEWNDANNALVGNGTSMVTLYYMRRCFSFFDDLIESVASKGGTTEAGLKFLYKEKFGLHQSRVICIFV